MRGGIGAVLAAALLATPAGAQSLLEKSPNMHGAWTLDRGRATFILAHRFEILAGGDELFSVPTFSLAAGIPLGFTLGLDHTTFSEAIPTRITGNETQYWLKRAIPLPGGVRAAGLGSYNPKAGSWDGAVSVRVPTERVEIFAEGRVFSNLFGDGRGAAGAIGAALRITRHLAVTGDIGRALGRDTVAAAWSGAIAFEIPGSPHTLSLQVTNSGATTLQGASRRKTIGEEAVRYGFAFTVPLGTLAQWRRILWPAPVPAGLDLGDAVLSEMRSIAFAPGELRIRAGEEIAWINYDPVEHTVTARDGSWGSPSLAEGGIFRRVFAEPGRFEYYCVPHPMMTGVVIVEP